MELQQELLSACIQSVPDLEYIGQLLQRGAHPLGRIDPGCRYAELVYPEILFHYWEENTDREMLLKITELFLRYGMDIEQPELAYDETDVINPLSMLSFHYGEYGVEILQRLLERGISVNSARECWEHILFIWCNMDGDLIEADDYEALFAAIRKIFLIASYPYIIENDQRLREEIWYCDNDYDLAAFRQWRNYHYLVEPALRRPGDCPQAYGAAVTVVETASGKHVWRFKFGIPRPEADGV